MTAPDLPPLPEAPPGRYVHHKGGEYELLGVVRHSETLEPLVLYRPLYGDAGPWVRPYGMFFETVDHDGARVPRFAPKREPVADAPGTGPGGPPDTPMPLSKGLPLRTPRLLLRPLRPDDADALHAIHADPEVMRYWSTPPWTSRQQAVDRIRRDTELLAGGTALRLALQPAGGGDIVGTLSLFGVVEPSRRAEIGYILGRSAWGQGLMHEALTALVRHAFGPLGLRRLEADIDPRNIRSAKSLERLGFMREGHLRERWEVAGEVSDTALYGLLAHEWPAARTGPLSVRDAAPSDLAAIRSVYLAAWRAAYAPHLPADRLESELATRAGYDWLPRIAGATASRVLVCEAGAGLVGVAEYAPRAAGHDAPPWLQMLYVLPQAWGTGAAAALLAAAESALRAQGHAEIGLEVVEVQARARRFYERHGWREDPAREPRTNGLFRVLHYRKALQAPAPGRA